MDTPRTREMTGQLEDIKKDIQEGVAQGQFSLADLQRSVIDNSKAAVETTDRLVHDNPWSSIGVAAAIGFAVGLLLPRR